ncbi:hypothetical protein, partial [Pseudomaricurvus sp.]|uniref:hypothetical protein n=1 Tax=Pseudomaricurvus sp. TaxID=2004510 RepID=UPI003F6AE738
SQARIAEKQENAASVKQAEKGQYLMESNSMGQDLKDNLDKQASEKEVHRTGVNQTVTRRNMAKAGMTAPLLMSLFSRPAWGGGVCSVSALASGNASGRHDDGCKGSGCTPGFWKNNTLAWQGTGFSPGSQVKKKGQRIKEWTTADATPFSSVFGFSPAVGNDETSLLDVLLQHHLRGSYGTYENHLVAALLNAAKAPSVYGATVVQIVELAQSVRSGVPYQGRVIDQGEAFGLVVKMNEAGDCFLNAKGDCGPGYVEVNGQCMPSCKDGERFDVNSQSCVLLQDWDPKTCKGVDD